MTRALSTKWTLLLRKEIWEHPVLSYRLPVGFAGLLVILSLVSALLGNEFLLSNSGEWMADVQVDGGDVDLANMGSPIAKMGSAVAAGFGFLGLLAGWSYLMSALYQERQDRSILFWLSLPVSDAETVLIKGLLGWLVIPAFYFGVGWAVGGVMTVIASVAATWLMSLSGVLLAAIAAYGANLFDLIALVVTQVLWSAPFLAWTLLASQWANRNPLYWVLGVPFAATLIENALLREAAMTDWFWSRLAGNPELGIEGAILSQSFQMFLGLGVAGGLVGLTILIRRHCYDRLP